MSWEVVIGLETHAQLSTVSKIFQARPPRMARSQTRNRALSIWHSQGCCPC